MILLLAQQESKWFLAAMVMFALPVLDTSLALARRWVNRRPLFSADRYHFHHQLVARGLSVRKTVLVSYSLAVGFVLLGGMIVFARTRYVGALYLVVFGSIIVAAYKMGMVHEKMRVVSRRELGDSATSMTPAASGDVLELREEPADISAVMNRSPSADPVVEAEPAEPPDAVRASAVR
jgi:UDP-GlcNAc:undecaprenyl-phosphate/decaprenyl-phosphate GlcNAc-1-phosphate transferase